MLVCADQCPAAERAASAVLPADAQMHVLEASAVPKRPSWRLLQNAMSLGL